MSKWNIDPAHTRIGFSVRHLGFAKVRGSFGAFAGGLDLTDAGAPTGWAEIQVGSINTGVADRDAHLRSADFFDAENQPTMRFQATSVEADDDGYAVTGEINIRGVTRPLRLQVEMLGEVIDPWGNRRVAFEARGSLNRQEFGLKWNQVLEAGGVVVSNKVDLEIEGQAVFAG